MIVTIGTSEWIQPVAKHDNRRAEEIRASKSFGLAYTPYQRSYDHYVPTVVRRGKKNHYLIFATKCKHSYNTKGV